MRGPPGLPYLYSTPEGMGADFNDTGSDSGATVLRTWEQECAGRSLEDMPVSVRGASTRPLRVADQATTP